MKILILVSLIILTSCGDKSPCSELHSGEVVTGPRPSYSVIGRCGWSYELQCKACEVRFSDGAIGGKCQ